MIQEVAREPPSHYFQSPHQAATLETLMSKLPPSLGTHQSHRGRQL